MEDNKENAAATEPVAAQPEATGTPPAKSATETKLEGQLAAATTKGDGYKKERDKLRLENGHLKADNERLTNEVADLKKPATPEVATTAAATEEPSEEERIKDILKRNGLKKCYMLTSGPCFSEAHAKEFAGPEFDSLTVITAE